MDTMIYQSGRDGRKEWNYLSFEGVILAPPKQFSCFAITTKRNEGGEGRVRRRAVRANNDLENNGGMEGRKEERGERGRG